MLTTPQLHFAVRATNSGGSKDEAFYFNTLAGGFKTLVEGKRGRPQPYTIHPTPYTLQDPNL